MACLHSPGRPQHCFYPLLPLASVIHDVGIKLRRRRLRGPAITHNQLRIQLVHPCNEHFNSSGAECINITSKLALLVGELPDQEPLLVPAMREAAAFTG
ncbi:unnamed protein product [Strongylus vulgaris]|uniref:Uncharacterized protein n=1 Tax=Strongylus vulgaris TaxID=40348 RepID=A0A3P7LKG7_STRVU|nr:unnamed protein product [Strongylus vulgaris]